MRPLGGRGRAVRTSVSYVPYSRFGKNGRTVEREHGDDERRQRDRTAGRDGAAETSSDRDFDATIARLEDLVRRFDQQVGFTVRGHLDHGRVDPGGDEAGCESRSRA